MISSGQRYQFTVFGNFQEFTPDPKIISEFIELFKDSREMLLPISIPKSDVKLESKFPSTFESDLFPIQIPLGLSFINQTRTFRVDFTGSKIDFHSNALNPQTYLNLEDDLTTFGQDIKYILGKIFEKYNKKAWRIALIESLISKEMTEDKIQTIFSKIFLFDELIMANENRHWSFRVTNRVSTNFTKGDEKLNCITVLSRATPNMCSLVMDVNTIPENKEERYGISEVSEFFDKTVLFQKQRLELLIKHIE